MVKDKFKRILSALGYSSSPAFLIIGAQKAGTSSLFFILKQHPLISSACRKEIHFFDHDHWYHPKKLYQYHALFPLPERNNPEIKYFEATPSYLYHPQVAERLHLYNPDLKLIVMLRNPAFRALSAWVMYHHHFKEGPYARFHDPRSFKEAILKDLETVETDNYYSNPKGYVKRGLYHEQLEIYFKLFKKDQILIMDSQRFKNDFHSSLADILNFLDLPLIELRAGYANKSKVESTEEERDMVNQLLEFYQPHNNKLFSLLGHSYNWDK